MKWMNWMMTSAIGASLWAGGCQESSEPAKPAPMGEHKHEAMAVMAGCPDKDCTHMVTSDQMVYSSVPGQGTAPVGMVKSGTKVLSMIPGAEYSQCTIAEGKKVYIKTSALKPVGTN